MAVLPTFTTGEVLTSSAANSMANSGLVYVAGGALATATTLFESCFTSSYRDYRIIISGVSYSASGDLYLRMLQGSSETVGTTLNNFWALSGFTAGATTANNSGASQNIMYLGASASGATTATTHVTIDITSPELAQVTLLTVQAASLAGTYTCRQGMCSFNTAAQFDGFAIKTLSATTVTGNVSIYGYRTA